MKLERVFDDLGDFVAAYRGAISREGMLHVTASHWSLGTTLKVDLRLVDGLVLVKGLATVIRVQLLPDGEAGWVVALKFLDLDPASRDLLDRLETRNEGEGVPPFRLSDPIVRPPGVSPRPAHRATPPPRPMPVDLGHHAEPTPAGRDEEPGEEYELAPEHEPHPALGGDLEDEPLPPVDAAPERTVPLGYEAEQTVDFEPLPPVRPLRGSETTLPMGFEEPPVASEPVPERETADREEDESNGRGSRVRVLLWIAALAAVAIIGVTLTWLLVPELFSAGRVAGSTVSAPTPAVETPSETAAQEHAPADRSPAETPPAHVGPGPGPADAVGGEAAPAAQVPATVPPPTAKPTSAPSPTAAPVPATGPLRVLTCDWNEGSTGTTVVITVSRPLDPSRVRSGRLEGEPGPRELIRLLDVDANELAIQSPVRGRDLAAIRTWLHGDRRPPELHIVLDLADPAVVAAPPEIAGTTLAIRLERGGG